jgi:hypothetical protein
MRLHLTLLTRLALLLAALLAAPAGLAQSHGASGENPAATGTDRQSIERFLAHTFDKPGEKLKVHASAVQGRHALATWSQGHKAGRALLERQAASWRILVCAGRGLIQAEGLTAAGIDAKVAAALTSHLVQAEATLPATLRAQADTFMMTEGAHDGHPSH